MGPLGEQRDRGSERENNMPRETGGGDINLNLSAQLRAALSLAMSGLCLSNPCFFPSFKLPPSIHYIMVCVAGRCCGGPVMAWSSGTVGWWGEGKGKGSFCDDLWGRLSHTSPAQ